MICWEISSESFVSENESQQHHALAVYPFSVYRKGIDIRSSGECSSAYEYLTVALTIKGKALEFHTFHVAYLHGGRAGVGWEVVLDECVLSEWVGLVLGEACTVVIKDRTSSWYGTALLMV